MQKLHESRADFEKQIIDKDKTIKSLQDELKEAHDSLRHLKLLSIIRSVGPSTTVSKTNPEQSYNLNNKTAAVSPLDTPTYCESTSFKNLSFDNTIKRVDSDHHSTNDKNSKIEASSKIPDTNDLFPQSKTKKRKLFSGQSFLA